MKSRVLILAALLGLSLTPSSQANLIANSSFETNPGVKQTAGYNAVTPWFSGVATDSGIEQSGGVQFDGTWSAYIQGSDAAAGVSASQLTSHVIQAGDSFVLSLHGRPLWTFTSGWGEANATLHWWMWAGTTATVISQGYFDLGIGNGNAIEYSYHESPLVSGAGFEGALIGISVTNSSGGQFGDPAGASPAFPAQAWAAFDSVELVAVPEPMSLGLLGLSGLLIVRRRQ